MNTSNHTQPLSNLDLVSVHLCVAGDLVGHLERTIATIGPDLVGLPDAVGRYLAELDRLLDDDAETASAVFVEASTTTIDAIDRRALLALLVDAGAAVDPTVGWPDDVPRPVKARPMTDIETVLLRSSALSQGDRHVGGVAALEAGGSSLEVASMTPADLDAATSPAVLHAAGDRDSVPRDLALNSWVPPGSLATLAAGTGRWLLHGSRSSDPDKRNSTLLMAVGKTIRQAGLPDGRTVTAKSIRRTGLRRIALDGPDGWAAAVAAAGHRNPQVTNDLLALHLDW